MHRKEDYGMFVNTLSRRRLEAMLNETENVAVSANETDDPFRIGNFATEKVIETRPMRQGCENFSSAAMLAISVAIIVLGFVLFSLLFCDTSFLLSSVHVHVPCFLQVLQVQPDLLHHPHVQIPPGYEYLSLAVH